MACMLQFSVKIHVPKEPPFLDEDSPQTCENDVIDFTMETFKFIHLILPANVSKMYFLLRDFHR